VYWASAALFDSTKLLAETRTIALDMGSDTADDTVHGDTFRSFAPTFAKAGIKVSGLYATGATQSPRLIKDAISKVSGTFLIYIGGTANFCSGSGYISVDNVGAPFDDFAPFDFSILPSATVGFSP
jgi:hypothetical protein